MLAKLSPCDHQEIILLHSTTYSQERKDTLMVIWIDEIQDTNTFKYSESACVMISSACDHQEMTLITDTPNIYPQEEAETEEEEDDETLMDESDDEIRYFKEPASLCDMFHSDGCMTVVYLGLLLCVLGSIVALIVISVHIVAPFLRVHYFHTGTCIPVASVTIDRKSCLCGIGCHVKYRCLSIKVKYKGQNNVYRNATLYEDETTLDNREVCYLLCFCYVMYSTRPQS